MTQLDRALARLTEHPGVQHVLLLGNDGLLVRHVGDASLESETVAAMVPGLVAACTALAGAAGRGAFSTAVVELTQGVALVTSLSPELLLAVLLAPNVGFGPLLRELRQERAQLAQLL